MGKLCLDPEVQAFFKPFAEDAKKSMDEAAKGGMPEQLRETDMTARVFAITGGFMEVRKDRVTITAGRDCLKAHRLSAEAGTRRVIATCCNTPIFLELKGGHWLSLYRAIWPDAERPAVEMRTMTGGRRNLPSDVPNLKTHSLAFYGRLFAAWAKMGFRNPHIADNGDLDVEG